LFWGFGFANNSCYQLNCRLGRRKTEWVQYGFGIGEFLPPPKRKVEVRLPKPRVALEPVVADWPGRPDVGKIDVDISELRLNGHQPFESRMWALKPITASGLEAMFGCLVCGQDRRRVEERAEEKFAKNWGRALHLLVMRGCNLGWEDCLGDIARSGSRPEIEAGKFVFGLDGQGREKLMGQVEAGVGYLRGLTGAKVWEEYVPFMAGIGRKDQLCLAKPDVVVGGGQIVEIKTTFNPSRGLAIQVLMEQMALEAKLGVVYGRTDLEIPPPVVISLTDSRLHQFHCRPLARGFWASSIDYLREVGSQFHSWDCEGRKVTRGRGMIEGVDLVRGGGGQDEINYELARMAGGMVADHVCWTSEPLPVRSDDRACEEVEARVSSQWQRESDILFEMMGR
jgi:hypothetical protein